VENDRLMDSNERLLERIAELEQQRQVLRARLRECLDHMVNSHPDLLHPQMRRIEFGGGISGLWDRGHAALQQTQ
jgi:hypothetical protein